MPILIMMCLHSCLSVTLRHPPMSCASLYSLYRFRSRKPSTGGLLIGVPANKNKDGIASLTFHLFGGRPFFSGAHYFIATQIRRSRKGTKNVQDQTGPLGGALGPIKGASEAISPGGGSEGLKYEGRIL